MTLARLLAPLALAVAAPALAQPGPAGPEAAGRPRGAYANPSAAIAADIAFARLAQAKGRWAAFRETAAPDAVMFVPQMVLAQPWLKKRPETAPLAWKPFAAWSSCDGSVVVTSGGWRSGKATGWYTTVWQRQEDGGYKWVLDHGGPAGQPLAEPDMLEARVAECPARQPMAAPAATPPRRGKARAKAPPVAFDPARRQGRAEDGSLTWQVSAQPDGAHRFIAGMMIGGKIEPIRDETVTAATP